jgi:uncharacterized protein YodC (DUF2158 family)
MDGEIKPGSIVRLKSGGPTMTVNWVAQAGQDFAVNTAACEWFIENKSPWKVEARAFPLTSLELLAP